MGPERQSGLDGDWLTPSPDELRSRVCLMDVDFCHHGESVKMGIVAQFATWFGDPNWDISHWLTLGRTIYYPNWVEDPFLFPAIVQHELVHVVQQSERTLPLWVLRYLTCQRFRWEMEREAYLVDIANGRPIPSVVEALGRDYRISDPPPSVMENWFREHV